MTVKLYGIRNCDTMKKARTWLEGRSVGYEFHDYRIAGVDAARLERWCREVGWETLLNRAGTTFRKLPDAAKSDLDQRKAVRLMLTQPSMIKRPVLEIDESVIVGFKPELYEDAVRRASSRP
jgi:arsenate reductase (glutaredoxin)